MADTQPVLPTAICSEVRYSVTVILISKLTFGQKTRDYIFRMDRIATMLLLGEEEVGRKSCNHLVFELRLLGDSGIAVSNVSLPKQPWRLFMAPTRSAEDLVW